ncbi:MAG: pyridoxamine kinase [Oscillospiraceae bacterium]|nr:pyridoxamine kinase [Oscillospiraceae bacterium]
MGAKRALCIHDMSGVGRCSLTIISPVLSVKGIQCVPLPTMVLSSHYGGFGAVARQELTGFCFDSLQHYSRIGVKFDCVYAGFLADQSQIKLVQQAFGDNPSALKICDPVMGDNGKIYSSVTADIMAGFKTLCHSSDIITPNTTEAFALLDKNIEKQIFTLQEAQQLVQELKDKYGCAVVITGIKLENGNVICCGTEKTADTPFTVQCNYIPVHFPGTGDLFCAVMTAEILGGAVLEAAVEKAARFVEKCVANTYTDKDVDTRFGVEIEQNLKYLI